MGGEGKLDGGLVSSPRDLAVLVRALAHGDLLGADATEQMQAFRPYGPDDREGIEDAYGLGLARIQTPYGPAVGHYGTVHPYQTLAFHLLDRDLTVALTANGYTGEVGDWINSEAPWSLVLDGGLR
jgi:CubicO group peptidase (beta-lactamase class C family)